MNNKEILLKELDQKSKIFFQILSNINGINVHTETYIKQYAKSIKENKNINNLPFSHLSSNLVIYNYGTSSNKTSTLASYSASNQNPDLQIQSNIKFHFALSLSHVYELFEILIKEISFVIEEYDKDVFLIIAKKSGAIPKDKEINTERLTGNIRTKDNKAYFQILSEIIPTLKDVQNNNQRNLNLNDWYKAFSSFRHSVVHSAMIYESDKLKVPNRGLFNKYFPATKHCNSPSCKKLRFNIDSNVLAHNILIVSEYSYFLIEELKKIYEKEESPK